MTTQLSNLKTLLGITDSDQDDKLLWILNAAKSRLLLLLGLSGEGTEVPEELSWIIVDVACGRFNRIGSEIMKSDSVEGESISFYDHDFDPYRDEISAWLASQSDEMTGGKGKVRFI